MDSTTARTASTSPTRHSIPQQIAALGARLTRGLSRDEADTETDARTRSLSRGREGYRSSGRGGFGNIHLATSAEERTDIDGPDDFSPTRGRELQVDSTKVVSTGRGGVGNIRSPSRSVRPSQGDVEYETDVLKQHAEVEKTAVHSSGRGGLGNIHRSRSRGPPY